MFCFNCPSIMQHEISRKTSTLSAILATVLIGIITPFSREHCQPKVPEYSVLMSAGLTVDNYKLFFKTMFVSLFFKDCILILIIVWHLLFYKIGHT